MPGLSRQKTAHALRHFIICGALWAIYGPNSVAAGAIFSGFALSIGISESQIAFLVAISSLAGAWQLVSFYITRNIHDKRRFLIKVGALEITLASAVIVLHFAPPGLRFPLMAAMLLGAYLLGHSASPIFNSWLSQIIPPGHRAVYIAQRMAVITLVSMVYLLLTGKWLDVMDKGYSAFAVIFAIGWVGGILGYVILLVTAFPQVREAPRENFARSLLTPFRQRSFTLLALFAITWYVASTLSNAFFGVYMINVLKLDYSVIAIFTNVTLLTMLLGYLLTGDLAQRYGSRPVAQLLIVPAMIVPLLWAFTTPGFYIVPLAIASTINGLCLAGLTVATSNLLYKLVPVGEENSSYFASWNTSLAVGAATGPFIGGLLRSRLPETMVLWDHSFQSLQIIFLLSTVVFVIPIIFSYLLQEGEARSPRYLLSQFRGNLLSFTYHAALYAVARRDATRADALLGLGKSRSPLAARRLIDELDHLSPQVRKSAARALGEGRFPEAIEPLLRELQDEDSDIRPEAAEALGKIGIVQKQLFAALGDYDHHVRASAAMALADLGTPEAQDALIDALEGDFDRNLFPILVDAAGRKPDYRLIAPALAGLAHLRAPVVRLQVINGICRVLGETNHFYRLATADEMAQGAIREQMAARIRRLLDHSHFGDEEAQVCLREASRRVEKALDADDLEELAAGARLQAEITNGIANAPLQAHAAAFAVREYLEAEISELPSDEVVIFLLIALTSMARALAEK